MKKITILLALLVSCVVFFPPISGYYFASKYDEFVELLEQSGAIIDENEHAPGWGDSVFKTTFHLMGHPAESFTMETEVQHGLLKSPGYGWIVAHSTTRFLDKNGDDLISDEPVIEGQFGFSKERLSVTVPTFSYPIPEFGVNIDFNGFDALYDSSTEIADQVMHYEFRGLDLVTPEVRFTLENQQGTIGLVETSAGLYLQNDVFSIDKILFSFLRDFKVALVGIHGVSESEEVDGLISGSINMKFDAVHVLDERFGPIETRFSIDGWSDSGIYEFKEAIIGFHSDLEEFGLSVDDLQNPPKNMTKEQAREHHQLMRKVGQRAQNIMARKAWRIIEGNPRFRMYPMTITTPYGDFNMNMEFAASDFVKNDFRNPNPTVIAKKLEFKFDAWAPPSFFHGMAKSLRKAELVYRGKDEGWYSERYIPSIEKDATEHADKQLQKIINSGQFTEMGEAGQSLGITFHYDKGEISYNGKSLGSVDSPDTQQLLSIIGAMATQIPEIQQ